jgi:hypothetical protein
MMKLLVVKHAKQRWRVVMSAKRIVAIVIGAFLVLIGLAVMVPGAVLLGAYGTLRDESGFVQTSERVVSTSGYALVSPDAEFDMGAGDWQWVPTGGQAAVRIEASSTGSEPIFIGIGPSDKVEAYMAAVAHDEVVDYGWESGVEYNHFEGGAPSSPPGAQTFWVARAEGEGAQSAEWTIEGGDWTAVVMNADGSTPVSANLSLGARFDILVPIGIAMTVVGVILLAGGIVLIVLGALRRKPAVPQQPPAGWVPPAGWAQPQTGWAPAPGTYAPPAPGTYAPPAQATPTPSDATQSGEPDPDVASSEQRPPAE